MLVSCRTEVSIVGTGIAGVTDSSSIQGDANMKFGLLMMTLLVFSGCMHSSMYRQESIPTHPKKITWEGVPKDRVYGAVLEAFHDSILDVNPAGTGKDAYLIQTQKRTA